MKPPGRIECENLSFTLGASEMRPEGHAITVNLGYLDGHLIEVAFCEAGTIGEGVHLLLAELGIKLSRAIQGRVLQVKLGEGVAEKLGWERGFKVRLEWSTKLDRIKITEPPPDHRHAYELKGGKGYLRLSSPAFPSGITEGVLAFSITRHEAFAPSPRSGGGILIVALAPEFKARKAA